MTRTVSLADNIQYTCSCMDTEPAYLDEAWANRHARHGRLEVNPLYTLSIIMGVQVTELTLGTTLGNLEMFDVTFRNPVYPGDIERRAKRLTEWI